MYKPYEEIDYRKTNVFLRRTRSECSDMNCNDFYNKNNSLVELTKFPMDS